LEREGLTAPPRVVIACLQDVRYLTAATRGVCSALAAQGSRCQLYGRDLLACLGPGVVGVALNDDDPLVDVWAVVLLSGTRPVAMAATDL
jgi:hypothetical protein